MLILWKMLERPSHEDKKYAWKRTYNTDGEKCQKWRVVINSMMYERNRILSYACYVFPGILNISMTHVRCIHVNQQYVKSATAITANRFVNVQVHLNLYLRTNLYQFQGSDQVIFKWVSLLFLKESTACLMVSKDITFVTQSFANIRRLST